MPGEVNSLFGVFLDMPTVFEGAETNYVSTSKERLSGSILVLSASHVASR